MVRLDARIPARVVGVFADYRDNTDLAYSIMASWGSVKEQLNARPEDQPFENTNGSTHCYALFNDRFTAADWDRQLPSFVKKYNPRKIKETSYPVIPFNAMHLSPEYGGVSRGLLLSLVLIGLLLIGTAIINLCKSGHGTRPSIGAREVGVRKVLGSTKIQLFWQFMGEATCIVLASLALATVVFQYGQSWAQAYCMALSGCIYFSPSVMGWLILLTVPVIFSGRSVSGA